MGRDQREGRPEESGSPAQEIVRFYRADLFKSLCRNLQGLFFIVGLCLKHILFTVNRLTDIIPAIPPLALKGD